jgi:hypothetical protein
MDDVGRGERGLFTIVIIGFGFVELCSWIE